MMGVILSPGSRSTKTERMLYDELDLAHSESELLPPNGPTPTLQMRGLCEFVRYDLKV